MIVKLINFTESSIVNITSNKLDITNINFLTRTISIQKNIITNNFNLVKSKVTIDQNPSTVVKIVL